MRKFLTLFLFSIFVTSAFAQIREPEGVRTPESERASAQCVFGSSNGDDRSDMLAKKAKAECVRNIDAKKNGLAQSFTDYALWRDHRQAVAAQRSATKTSNCIITGANTFQCQ